MFYRTLLRPVLFSLTRHDPEEAHTAILRVLATISRSRMLCTLLQAFQDNSFYTLARDVFGLHFPNPVGLAAGYDKDGIALPALAALGFGFLEIGTVTWLAQPGNPRPRIFRMPAADALVNRMGFNNSGAMAMATNLASMPSLGIPIGISLGKSRRTPLEEAINDYRASLRTLYPYGDFFTINISSPNTPGLRTLQERDHLDSLLAALRQEMANQPAIMPHQLATTSVVRSSFHTRPLLVKIAPDLSDQAILEVLEVCTIHQVSGIIATNTSRVGPDAPRPFKEAGGLSGRPLSERSLEVVRFISRETAGRLPIIGVGGIFKPEDAQRMLAAGASLVQVYTGLIYEGPGIVRQINRGLV